MIDVIKLLKDMVVEVIELHEVLTDKQVIADIRDAVSRARDVIKAHHKEHVVKRKTLWDKIRRR